MKFVSILLLLLGYMLVYAAIANHGKQAGNPWAGLFLDAYTGPQPTAQPQLPIQPPGVSSAPSTRLRHRAPPTTSGGVPVTPGTTPSPTGTVSA